MKFLFIFALALACSRPDVVLFDTENTASYESDDSISRANTTNDSQFYDSLKFSILDEAIGDLNLDGIKDKLVILKQKGEENMLESPVARPLLLLLGNEKGSYELAAWNDSVVLCFQCGGVFGDPYEGLKIETGKFEINHYGGSNWRWTRSIEFTYDKAKSQWILSRDEGISFHVYEPEVSEDVFYSLGKIGKLKFEEFNNGW